MCKVNEPLVSIIVPIYNVEKYLERCLDSILNQTYENIQVLLVNDGATDSSRAIAKKFEDRDKRFVIYDKPNGGLSSARNYGFNNCQGEYIAFIDSDDFISKDYTEKLFNAFDYQTDVVIADYAIYDEDKKKYYSHANMLKAAEIVSDEEKRELLVNLSVVGSNITPVWKNMYRTSFLKNYNLQYVSEREIYSEDLLYNLQAYHLARKVKIINEIVYYHLVVSKSLSQGYRKTIFTMNKKLLNEIIIYCEKNIDRSIVEVYSSRTPNIVASSILTLCKCNHIEAINNIRGLLDDEYTKNILSMSCMGINPLRHRVLFCLGKTKNSFIIVLSVKTLIKLEAIYRYFQKRNEYVVN